MCAVAPKGKPKKRKKKMQRRNWNLFAGHSGSGGHGHDHDHTSDHSHDQGEVDGVDLFPQIDMDKVRCLNDRRSSGKCCLKPYAKRLDHTTYLLSEEDDPEIILHIPFTEAVRLAGICICADDNTNAPRNVKIFVNRDDVDFGLAEDLKADLYLKDMHKDVSADVIYFPRTFYLYVLFTSNDDKTLLLQYTAKNGKFTTCHSITIYVEDNWGGDETRINYIGMWSYCVFSVFTLPLILLFLSHSFSFYPH